MHMYGIFNNKDNEFTGLSTEALSYGAELNELSKDNSSDIKDIQLLMEGVNIVVSVESKMHMLDNQLVNIDKDNYVNLLTDISAESMKLYGSENELSTELDKLAELAATDLTLSVEAYGKKRNTILDQLVRKIWDGLENIISSDSWLTSFDTVKHVFTSEGRRLEQLQAYSKELKSGARIVKKNGKLSKSTERLLGIYMSREDKFTFNLLHKQLEEMYKLFTGGIINEGLASIHDSLVQGVGEEVTIVTDKPSLDYVRSFKRIDLPELDVSSIKMSVPVNTVGTVFSLLNIIQDREDGMDFEHITRKVTSEIYSDIKVGSYSEKDIMELNNLLLNIIPELRKQTNKKDSKRIITEFVKGVRSKLATVVYGSVFGVFALRRVIRQIYLANKFITSIMSIYINQYSEWTKVTELQLKLIDELTEIKR